MSFEPTESHDMFALATVRNRQLSIENAIVASSCEAMHRIATQTHAKFTVPLTRSSRGPSVSRIGEYELLSILGKGGMGIVYEARHARSGHLVALKTLPFSKPQKSRARRRFKRETRILAQLDHPNIVRAIDSGETKETPFLVMEMIEGCNLSELMKAHGPLALADACEIARQAALGLQHIYENDLVHRDIKPANLMLAAPVGSICSSARHSSSSVKILDLGLARDRVDTSERGELAGTGYLVGTIDYMAPEQLLDIPTVDIRADIFSLGATLYKLLSGKSPLERLKRTSVANKIAAIIVEPISSLRSACPEAPENLVAIVDEMLAPEADHCFITPADVAESLEAFAQEANLAALATVVSDVTKSREIGSTITQEYRRDEPLLSAINNCPDATTVWGELKSDVAPSTLAPPTFSL